MDQPTILIASDDAAFSSAITARWHAERVAPAFILMGSDLCCGLDPGAFELAIVGEVRPGMLQPALKEIELTGKTVILVSQSAQLALVPSGPRVMVLHKYEGWLEAVVLLSAEVLRRIAAVDLARCTEAKNATLERQATLGRYMLDMRHNLNNALTSVLGNAELLLLEPGSLSARVREQIETVRSMSLRMHEVLHRFSSLDMELQVVERLAEHKKHGRAHSAASGK